MRASSRSLGLSIASVVMGVVAVVAMSSDALASPPAERGAKEDSKISSLIRNLLPQALEPQAAQTFESQDDEESAGEGVYSSDGLVRVDKNGNIQTYITVNLTADANVSVLETHDVLIELVNADLNIVQGWIPLNRVEDVALLEFVERIRPPSYARVNAGSITTEGDSILNADQVRDQLGYFGANVNIGVISDGADSIASSQATGDLPPAIEIDPGRPGSGDEGTAMMEIVHDLALGANLAFAGPSTSLEMINSINFLANNAFGGVGADIIVDDLGFFGEPYFEDGPIAQTVNAVRDNGTIYITAAGNESQGHYEADFVRGPNDFHDFGGGDAMSITVTNTSNTFLVLQWNDQFGVSDNDFDLYACDPGQKPIPIDDNSCFLHSTGPQNGNDSPVEFIEFSTPGSYDVFIHGFFVTQPRRLELFAVAFPRISINDPQLMIPAGGVFGHQAALGAIAVGAINASDSGHDDIATYSSHGPSDVFFPAFESRLKPDIAAIDGVSVTGVGFVNPFFGTSAAAPHVAGVAALVLEAARDGQPGISKLDAANLVSDTLKGSAVDLGDPNVYGAGRVDALAAVNALPEPPPTPTPTPAPTPVPVPSMSTWGMIALAALFAVLMMFQMRRRSAEPQPLNPNP